jgi:beta-mannosidase
MTVRRELRDSWVLRTDDGEVAAAVPGTVHTDLLRAGRIPDPYLGRNETDLEWIGHRDWSYETTFEWQPSTDGQVDLACDGLDTVAAVELNGNLVARTYNMHRRYRFPVAAHLRPGANRLRVTFRSAIAYAQEQRAALGELPGPGSATPYPFNMIRKMACNFGWDWGPALVTAGIWRPVRLESWHTARLAEVRPAVTVEDGDGVVRLTVVVQRAGPGTELRMVARIAEVVETTTVPPGTDTVTLRLRVPSPDLWWPHGHGDQPRYGLDVTLAPAVPADADADAGAAGDAATLDTWTGAVGFRSVRLDTTPDDTGSAFTLVINDVPLFARGANWIPDDCFPSRVGPARYRERIAQAKAANVNLLRVWGGGIYESGDFYDACDEAGILVWQDFLFACAGYPEEEPLGGEVAAEARDAVSRLIRHPSLVLWNGNNENYMGWHEWGWPAVVGDRTWGHGYYSRVLPEIVASLDGSRPYWPGSPYSGTPERPSGLDGYGCKHIWDVWNRADYTVYRDYVPRFVSEFGWQAPPTWATVDSSLSDRDPTLTDASSTDTSLTPESPAVLHHQKAIDGNGKLARGLAPHFPAPTTMDNWLYLNQLNQARAIALGVEHFRAHRGTCMGTVVWQLNDCWPATSWAAIDGYGRRKPLWYALRRAYDQQLVTVQPTPDGLSAVLVNDGVEAVRQPLTVRRYDVAGTVLAEWGTTAEAPGGGTAWLPLPAELSTAGDPAREFIVVDPTGIHRAAGARRAMWFFVPDKYFAYPTPAYSADVDTSGRVPVIRITAHTFLRDLAVFADRVEPGASVDDMLVTLVPGEHAELRLSSRDPAAFRGIDLVPPVLRCANDAVLAERG